MDNKRRKKTLDEFDEDKFVVGKVTSIFDVLEDVKKERNSTQLIRDIIQKLGQAYNPYLNIPPEILTLIFLHLPSKDLLSERSVFRVCRDWYERLLKYRPFWNFVLRLHFNVELEKGNGFDSDDIRNYCLLRYSLLSRGDQKFTPNCRGPFVVGSKEQYCNNNENMTLISVSGTDSLLAASNRNFQDYTNFTANYVLWMKQLVSLHVIISSTYFHPYTDYYHLKYTKFNIDIGTTMMCRVQINSKNKKIVVNRDVFHFLEEKGLVSFLIEKKLVNNFKNTSGLSGTLRNYHAKENVMKKILLYLFSLLEVILMKLKARGEAWNHSRHYFFGVGINDLTIDNFFVMRDQVGFVELPLKEYLKNESFFKNPEDLS